MAGQKPSTVKLKRLMLGEWQTHSAGYPTSWDLKFLSLGGGSVPLALLFLLETSCLVPCLLSVISTQSICVLRSDVTLGVACLYVPCGYH